MTKQLSSLNQHQQAALKTLHTRLLGALTYHASTGEFTTRVDTTRRARAQLAGTLRKDGSYIVSFEGNLYTASRLAYFYKTGQWPSGPIVMKTKRRCIEDYRWSNLVATEQSA